MSYIGVPPFGQTVRTITERVATAGQAVFSPDGGYIPGYIDVMVNGAVLQSSDFTATNGSTVTLLVACAAGDDFKAIAYWPVSLTDTYRKGEVDAGFVSRTSSSGAALMPVGTTGQRPSSPTTGMFRLNSTTGSPEWYEATNNMWLPFTMQAPYLVEYLVVAGGGAGGVSPYGGGGGGGGGVLYNSAKLVMSPASYTVIVGAGGTSGYNGGDSQFGAAIAYGGGGGSGYAGGSGGGGGHTGASGQFGVATQTSNDGGIGYGNNGGTNTYSGNFPCGAGGGAGAAGGQMTNGGAGRLFSSFSSFGASGYFAGGGGAADNVGNATSGGIGGGASAHGGVGAANTGGGGGGGKNGGSGAGGSGIVLLRYLGPQRGTGGVVTSSGGYTYHAFTTSGTYAA